VEGARRLVPVVQVPTVELGHRRRRGSRSRCCSTSVLGRARGLSAEKDQLGARLVPSQFKLKNTSPGDGHEPRRRRSRAVRDLARVSTQVIV
jgi:hypothetical protein